MKLHLFVFAAALALPAFAEDADTGDAGRAKALTLLNEGKVDEAKALLQKVVKDNTEDFAARLLLGRLELESGDLEGAEKQFKTVMENDEKDLEAAGRMAELLAYTGKHDEAVKLAEATLAKDEKAHHARVALGTVQLEKGKGAEAEKTLGWFVEYLEKSPGLKGSELFTICRGLWPLALRNGDKDLIKRVVNGDGLLNDALDLGGVPEAELFAFWGHCQMDKYNALYAKKTFEDALKKNPKCASAIYGMARVLAEGGRMPQALAGADQALQINPRLVDALLFKAAIQGQMQQLEPAGATVQLALKINPRSVQGIAMLAAAAELAGKKDEREKHEKKLAEINPNSGLGYYYIGEALSSKMLFEEANVYLKKAVEADPKLWDAFIEYGMNALRLGDEGTALKYLSEAQERDPFHTRLFNTMVLMDSFPKDFVVVESKHFRIRMHKKEVDIIGPYVMELHERAWDELAKRYHFEPQAPIVCDMYPNHNDFSVRTVGMSGLGALGACFGKVCTLLSPRAKEVMGKFNWGSVVWHELGHVWALQLSKNRVPRWFTEGLSTYEEKLGYPAWERELEGEMFMAFHGKKLMKIDQLHAGGDLLNLYLYGSLITEFIATRWHFDKIPEMLKLWGEGKDTKTVFQTALGMTTDQFDNELHAWLKDWLKNVGLRMPFRASREEAEQLEAAVEENPMDAEALGRLARILASVNRKADAETLAKKALKIDEFNIDALVVLAESMGTAERRRFDKAAEYYKRAIDAGATDFQTRQSYALMLCKAGQWDEAIVALRESKKAFPRHIAGDDNPYRKLIEIFKDRKQDDDVLAELEALASMDHDSFKLRMELAEIHQKRGNRDAMVKHLEAALYIGVFDTKLHAWLGRAYRDAAKHEKALHEFKCCVTLLKEADQKEPGKWVVKIAEFHAEGAAMAKELGKTEEARTMAKESLLGDPTNELARKVLESLK